MSLDMFPDWFVERLIRDAEDEQRRVAREAVEEQGIGE